MSDVKRYDTISLWGRGDAGMAENSNGDWVKYTDYAALSARVAKLEAENRDLHAICGTRLLQIQKLESLEQDQ